MNRGKYRLVSAAAGLVLLVSGSCSQTPSAVEAKEEPPSPVVESKYEEAKLLYDQKQYKPARSLLQQAFAAVKNTGQKEKVIFLLGEVYFMTAEYEAAEETYQSFLGQFPKSDYFNEAARHLYETGFKFLEGARIDLWGMPILPGEDHGLKIIRDLVKRYPFNEFSEKSQMRLADWFYKQEKYSEAQLEYDLFIKTYQRSEFLPRAQFNYAACYLNKYWGSNYDNADLIAAREEFQRCLEKYPDSGLAAEAEKKLAEIDSEEGERDYLVADYYFRTGHLQAARVYFSNIVKTYPRTSWASKAKEMLEREYK